MRWIVSGGTGTLVPTRCPPQFHQMVNRTGDHFFTHRQSDPPPSLPPPLLRYAGYPVIGVAGFRVMQNASLVPPREKELGSVRNSNDQPSFFFCREGHNLTRTLTPFTLCLLSTPSPSRRELPVGSSTPPPFLLVFYGSVFARGLLPVPPLHQS
eukprot:Hpha_TRINITY_DN16399_c1_g3::TRINITY_DN16399_c1_g3_i1::g.58793::m.58793